MLDQLGRDEDDEIEVIWPSAYAAPVLRFAVADALKLLGEASRADADLQALAITLATAWELVTTLRAFLAVDNWDLWSIAS
jgi:hypothetical protein